MKKIILITVILLALNSIFCITFAQSDSTFARINIFNTNPGDSLYQFKELLLKMVPELNEWNDDLKIVSNNTVNLYITLEDTNFSTPKGDSSYYEFYVGENHQTHTVVLQHFLICKDSKMVYAYDLPNDIVLTLKEWRNNLKNIHNFNK